MTSRKRWNGPTRFGSPPLQPQPLQVRNLTLLPVSLSDLPNDASFVEPLRSDVDALLRDFSRRWRSQSVSYSAQAATATAATNNGGQATPSPFQVFTQSWLEGGWDYVHFAYGDHPDTQAGFCQTIARVLLERIAPLADKITGSQRPSPSSLSPSSSLETDEVLAALGVVFGLFVLWDTQLYPESGVGVAHMRRPMETIKVEADILDLLLRLPQHCADALRTSRPAPLPRGADGPRPEADLIYVLRRLCGISGCFADEETSPTRQRLFPAKDKRPRHGWRKGVDTLQQSTRHPRIEAAASNYKLKGEEGSPIFDVIPSTDKATRMPRTFPASKLTSRMKADRLLDQVATAVAVRYEQAEEDGSQANDEVEAGADDNNSQTSERERPAAGDPSQATKQRKVVSRRVLGGLSRGDVVRLRARERLGLNPASGVLDVDTETEEPRVEMAPWFGGNKGTTTGLKPWLDTTSGPLHAALEEVHQGRDEYAHARRQILSGRLQDSSSGDDDVDANGQRTASSSRRLFLAARSSGSSSSSSDDDSDHDEQEIDYPARLLLRFADDARVGQATLTGTSSEEEGEGIQDPTDAVDSSSQLTLADLYRIAARRTRKAVSAAREEVDRRTGPPADDDDA